MDVIFISLRPTALFGNRPGKWTQRCTFNVSTMEAACEINQRVRIPRCLNLRVEMVQGSSWIGSTCQGLTSGMDCALELHTFNNPKMSISHHAARQTQKR